MQKYSYSDMSRIHFTADQHFGHANILWMSERPWSTVDEMDEALIQRWNENVGGNDHVWFLGDFAHRCHPIRLRSIFDRLKGVKHLICGNHDKKPTLALPWASQHDMAEVVVEGQRVILSHYAMRVWPGSNRGAVHFYGHSHGKLPGSRRSLDVGVDSVGYEPVLLSQALNLMVDLPDVHWHHGHLPAAEPSTTSKIMENNHADSCTR